MKNKKKIKELQANKQKLVREAVIMLLDDIHNYEDYVSDLLNESLSKYRISYLKELLGYE